MIHVLWPFRRNRRVLKTRLGPEQCYKRLKASVGHWLDFVPEPLVRGAVFPDRFRIVYRHRYQNAFQTVGRGRLLAQTDGALVVVKFSMNRLTLAFLVLPFGLAFYLIWAALLDKSFSSLDPLGHRLWAFGILTWWLIGVGVGLWYARHDAPLLIAFLKEILEAEEIEGGVPPGTRSSLSRSNG